MTSTRYTVTASFYTPEPDSRHLRTVRVSQVFDDSTPYHEIDDALADAAFSKFDEEHGRAGDLSAIYDYEKTQISAPESV